MTTTTQSRDARIEIFWSDDDGGDYIANCTDLAYCSAFGETEVEALAELLVERKVARTELMRPIATIAARRMRSVYWVIFMACPFWDS